MLLSAAMIVRDEAAHLGACLASLDGVVDEVVVVDTGSTDATAEIAAACGAVVVHERWHHDFARARNCALDRARGRWILYLDADERVRRVGDLRARLEDDANVAVLVRFRVMAGYTRFWEHRLFRNRPDIRFQGAIHETMVPDIHAVMEREGAAVATSEVEVDHLGYEGDLGHKHHRDLPLLVEAVGRHPGRSYLWHRLGRAWLGLGDEGAAEAAWEQGVEAVRAEEAPKPVDVLAYADLALHRLARSQDCHDLIGEMARRFGDDHLVRWARAQQAMLVGRYEEALTPLMALAGVDPDALVHPCLAYDQRIFGELAYHGLGTCWFHLGDHDTAASWFARAEEASAAPEYRVKRQLAEAMAARP